MAHGWGEAVDQQGNKLKLLCIEGVTVKVIMVWKNDTINVFNVNGDTLIGPATDFYSVTRNAYNFMYDASGKEIGKS